MRAPAAALLVVLVGATSASAADTPAWKPFNAVDAITDARREGLSYENGEDGLFVVCTHQKDAGARQRFWIAVKTGSPLGRHTIKPLTYRVGDDPPTTSRWEYTPRQVVPSWPMEDRHIVERIIDRKAEIAFRLFLYDERAYDVTVPIDAAARDLMAQTIAKCRS